MKIESRTDDGYRKLIRARSPLGGHAVSVECGSNLEFRETLSGNFRLAEGYEAALASTMIS
jgi:hypothetical protein